MRRPPSIDHAAAEPRTRPPQAHPEVDLSLLWLALAGLAVLALALASGAGAQPPAQERPAGAFASEVEVTEVLLDALVTDRDGNAILGLGPGDFRVTEDGHPVTIADLTFYSNRRYLDAAGAARLGIDPASVPDRRYFILFFDDQRASSLQVGGLLDRQMRAGLDARAWLERGLEPGDLVAVASFDYKLKLHADFTADRAQLSAAIDAAVRGADGRQDWPSRRGESADLPALAAALPAGKALRDATPRIYDALRVLADAAAAIPGRKNLLLYSAGFGDLDRLGSQEFGRYTRDQRFYPPMARALNGANVAVYGVDLTPLGVRNELQNSLNDLAVDTGARLFFNLLSFTRPLEDVARETNGYYLLAYRSERPAGASGFQKVEVAAVNPEFRITARRGYRYGG